MNEVEPWTFKLNGGIEIEVTEDHIEAARRLIEEGWYQVSRRHRLLSRLPEKTTGKEALINAEGRSSRSRRETERWANALGDFHAGDQYLRCYAHLDQNCCEVDIPTFAAYRKLGGGTYS